MCIVQYCVCKTYIYIYICVCIFFCHGLPKRCLVWVLKKQFQLELKGIMKPECGQMPNNVHDG